MLIDEALFRCSVMLVNGERSSGVPRDAANADSCFMLEGYLSRGYAAVNA